jgi:hypothetical protein
VSYKTLDIYIVVGDYCFDWLFVTSHQLLWVLYMSILPSLYQPQSNIFIHLKIWVNSRYNRRHVGSTDKSSLLEFLAFHGRTDAMSVLPDPPVEPTRPQYTDKTSLSHFLRTPGSTDPMSVLPITGVGL